jgi:hypothetical protein
MIKQYPHFLFIVVNPESVQDAEGNFIKGSSSVLLHSVCREETNGKGSTINGTDGRSILYSSTVFLPITAVKIAEGTQILVGATEDPNSAVRIKGQVLKYDEGQLHSRLWL